MDDVVGVVLWSRSEHNVCRSVVKSLNKVICLRTAYLHNVVALASNYQLSPRVIPSKWQSLFYSPIEVRDEH